MFKIGTQRLTWIAVKWNGLADDGTQIPNEVQLRVELVDRTVLREQYNSEREGERETLPFAQSVTKDWKHVGDADGHPLAFSPANFALLFEVPGFAQAWGTAYLAAWNGISGIREKNSATSPADGPAAGGTGATPAA